MPLANVQGHSIMNAVRVISSTLLILVVGACAQDPAKQATENSSRVQCPPGETMVCEVRNTGRIVHGSFSKGNSRCACKDERSGSPNIPGIR
jgi:hypothetical protein